MDRSRVYIVVPAYHEESTIGKLVFELRQEGYKNIIVVDDGSEDKTFTRAKEAGAKVLRLPVNRGTGGALRTGFAYALKQKAEVVVMMDADLQHKVEDIDKLVKPILKGEADIVLGSRLLREAKLMPPVRRLANFLGNLITGLLHGIVVSDSQSGFRAIKAEALAKMDLKSSRFEICSEMIGEIKRLNLVYKEMPISTVYTSYSLSKGQSFKNGLKTLARLVAIKLQR